MEQFLKVEWDEGCVNGRNPRLVEALFRSGSVSSLKRSYLETRLYGLFGDVTKILHKSIRVF